MRRFAWQKCFRRTLVRVAPHRRDRPHRASGEQADVRRVVNIPDGRQYEIVGTAKDWKLGTGSMVLDAVAFLWALVRQARGKEWVVVVRRAGTSDPILTRTLRSRDLVVASVTELVDALASGDFAPPAD